MKAESKPKSAQLASAPGKAQRSVQPRELRTLKRGSLPDTHRISAFFLLTQRKESMAVLGASLPRFFFDNRERKKSTTLRICLATSGGGWVSVEKPRHEGQSHRSQVTAAQSCEMLSWNKHVRGVLNKIQDSRQTTLFVLNV